MVPDTYCVIERYLKRNSITKRMANPLLLWLILLAIFILMVGVFYKIIRVFVKSLLYALIIFIITGVVFMFFAYLDFQKLVQELDESNYYVLEDGGKIMLGYHENSYNLLSESEIDELNQNKAIFTNPEKFESQFKSKNIFAYSKRALENRNVQSITFLGGKISREEVIAKLYDNNVSLLEREELFSKFVQSFDSQYIFDNYRAGYLKVYPPRLLMKFVDYSPEFMLPMFGFVRYVEEKQNGQTI